MTQKTVREGTGLVHIYCGDGKGKTTAAIGQCVRSAGFGYRVLICRFMKDSRSSELTALAGIPGITIMPTPENVKFSFRMTEDEKEAAREEARRRLQQAAAKAAKEAFDVLLLDEAIYAVNAGLLPEEELIAVLRGRPGKLEVLLTGRDPSEQLMAEADYISEIRKIKHPFDRGQRARDGIER